MNRKVNPVFLCKQCVVSDTRQPQVERRTAKVCLSETDVLPLCHATNHGARAPPLELGHVHLFGNFCLCRLIIPVGSGRLL